MQHEWDEQRPGRAKQQKKVHDMEEDIGHMGILWPTQFREQYKTTWNQEQKKK